MALLLRQHVFPNALPREILAISLYNRPFSVLNRPPPNYPGHVALTGIERAGLAVGSAVLSLLNPRRGGTLPSQFVPQQCLQNCRPHSSPRRSNRNAIFYLPPPRRHARLPHRAAHPPRPPAHHLHHHAHALSPQPGPQHRRALLR